MGNRIRITGAFALLVLTFLNMNCGSAPSRRYSSSNNNFPPTSRSMASIPNPNQDLLKKLMWPLTHHRISQEFNADVPHDGIDIPAPKGTRIYAPADGRVVYAGHKFHGYGQMIVIAHSNRVATLYGHCSKLLVRNGDIVHRGSLIGLVGRTGRATANHLHFEVRIDKMPVDPLRYLP